MTNFRSLLRAVIVLLLGCVLWVIHHRYHLPALLSLRNINKLRAVLYSLGETPPSCWRYPENCVGGR
jgi:hypothetical protein